MLTFFWNCIFKIVSHRWINHQPWHWQEQQKQQQISHELTVCTPRGCILPLKGSLFWQNWIRPYYCNNIYMFTKLLTELNKSFASSIVFFINLKHYFHYIKPRFGNKLAHLWADMGLQMPYRCRKSHLTTHTVLDKE